MHLKYAVEVERTNSITKAAENLFMGQPNLSRALRDLEENLGIIIFNRTPKGMFPTQQGEIFLSYAKKILRQIDEIEAIYKNKHQDKLSFRISIPRASYISLAFTNLIQNLDSSCEFEFNYRETNNMRAINNILQNNYDLGIIRFQSVFEEYFMNLLQNKELAFEPIFEFEHLLLMSKDNPLALKEDIVQDDLKDFIEIAHGDPYVPSLPVAEVRKSEFSDFVSKRIFIYERASQFELLRRVPKTYIWVSPAPDNISEQNGLIQKKCKDEHRKYKDILIYKKHYRLNKTDKLFLKELKYITSELYNSKGENTNKC